MNIFKQIYQRARRNPKRIILPETAELRVLVAAAQAQEQGLARIILLGQPNNILKKAKQNKLDFSQVEIINPLEDDNFNKYAQVYWELRKHKGVTLEQAKDILRDDFVYYAAMMLREGRADGFVAGACHTTSDVARAALHCLKIDALESTTISGAFLVQIKDKHHGENGLFLFADCGIVPLPSAKQLANIAISSAGLWTKVTGAAARLAMLSFSSMGSSSHPCVDKVKQAVALARKSRPDLLIDGELQVDSAVEPAVAKIKVPQSVLAGRANILIFPNLEAGNIAYKLMQRLVGARVVGPIIQGMEKPCSDLSRGCSPQEIVDAIAITTVRAQ